MAEVVGEQIDGADILLGRATYQSFAGSWPQPGDEVPLATRINAMPKLVVSTTLTSVAWQNTTVVAGEVPEELAKIKEQPSRNVTVSGSPTLVRSLLRNCLLDKLQLLVHPLVRGHGRRWLEDGLAQPLELIGSRRRAQRCDRARGTFPTGTSPPKPSRTLGREITYVDAPDDAVRDAPPGFGLDEWFVSALVGLSGLTADPASMAMPARSATPWLTGQPARSLDDLLQEVAPDLKAGSIPVSLMIQAGSSPTAGNLPAFTPPQLLVEQAQ